MKALLNLFKPAPPLTVAGVALEPSMVSVMKQPMEFDLADLRTLSLAANRWASVSPGSPAAKRVAFKVDAVLGAYQRAMGEAL